LIRLAVAAVLLIAYESNHERISDLLDEGNGQMYGLIGLVVVALVGISVLRAVIAIGTASRSITNFEQPYQAMRAAERQRHEQALAEWERAVRAHQQAVAEARTVPANEPLWYPVFPASPPGRVDILGGDTQRHGWASLLTTLGAAELAAGERLTLLDFTGRDVAGGLLGIAQARGIGTYQLDLPMEGVQVNVLGSVARRDIPECLAYATTGRREATDLRMERALITEVLDQVMGCLDGAVTFARLAAGVQVLRRVTPDEVLTPAEINKLSEYVGEHGTDEWTGRQLRFLGTQLTSLAGLFGAGQGGGLLWTGAPVSVVRTAGGQDDRKELLDRLLVQLAQLALQDGARFASVLVLAGADHLGTATLERLSDHARQAGVRLILMIDQPQGDAEKLAGTGGSVCIMKMYNHRDANVAADFIGRGYKFVVSQLTQQVGKTFTDGGGDSFGATTTQGVNQKPGFLREAGRRSGLSESRGHTWTGTRNWTTADNMSTSTAQSRVYEFTVDPQEILGMPETAFIMVDNSAQGRQVVMADSNPGICLLDRVSPAPAARS
jgi:hypothetical protein